MSKQRKTTPREFQAVVGEMITVSVLGINSSPWFWLLTLVPITHSLDIIRRLRKQAREAQTNQGAASEL